MIPWLRPADPFPPVESALKAPCGLLAASDGLDADRLVRAYCHGIFPWFAQDEPVLWWSPDPRMVLWVDELRVTRSLRKKLRAVARSAGPQVFVDRAFLQVIRHCAAPRAGQEGTWITPSIIGAYTELHRRGLAHSVEVWRDDDLVGGLYGVAIGRMVFGESMFAREPDASKIALAALVRLMQIEGARVIDCQQNTQHLASLGAREIGRREFCSIVRAQVAEAAISWSRYSGAARNDLLSGY
jgi:leucyl/phenylalanyl-tRNA--protein transferase